MSFTLNKDQMLTVCVGACVLASGGGGSYVVSTQIIQQGVQPNQTATVVEVGEVIPDYWLCVCANMGAPDALFKTTNPYATGNAVMGLQGYLQATNPNFTEFSYVCPVEVGAINSASPLTVGAQKGLPVIDADGAGRSIPTLPLDTFAANAMPLFPNCIASNSNPGQPYNTASINIAGSAPEAQAELAFLGVMMSDPFGGICGLAMYVMQGQTLQNYPPVAGTLYDALVIGGIVNTYVGQEQVTRIVNYLKNQRPAGPRISAGIFHGYITNMTESVGGTDVGQVVVSANADGSGQQLIIYFQNEILFAYLQGQAEPYIMGPDSICYVPADVVGNQVVFDNSDLWNLYQQGYRPEVYVLGIDAPAIVKSNQTLMNSWQNTLSQFGYPGPYVQNWLNSKSRRPRRKRSSGSRATRGARKRG